ncbi:hypothetical protein [Enterococcus ratti]|uniref:WxL domain-containing protein n=1 Tax=Enterococcus ratti TaxID=150033 RepID=A0A1L8WG93_9ENTE|nr:hypothetical protein [Enterococcus ratti]OJG80051.1 hypothetical protein RV14_GL000710 [Enterococcus ratti]
MKKKTLLVSYIILLMLFHAPVSFAEDAADQIYENYITNYLSNNARWVRDAQNASLGYLKGNKMSYEVTRNFFFPEYNAGGGVRYIGSLTLESMTTYVASDGSFKFYYDPATYMVTIERLKNTPIDYDFNAVRIQAFLSYAGTKYMPSMLGGYYTQSLKSTYATTIYGPANLNFEAPPEIVGTTTVDKLVLAKNESIDALDPTHYVSVSQHMDGGQLFMEWIKRPDTSVVGEQMAQIRVTDRLDDYVQSKLFNLPVVVEDTQLTAEPNSQTTILGSEVVTMNLSDFVQNVKVGDQMISADQYTVELLEPLVTNIIGNKTAKLRVTLNADQTKTTDVLVPVSVLWGYTIGSNNVPYPSSTGFSLSLLTSTTPAIVATLGNDQTRNSWLNDHINGTYISVEIFKNPQLLNDSQTNPYLSLILGGQNETLATATDKWNRLEQRKQLAYGDILAYQVDSRWGDNKWVMRDEVQQFESEGKGTVYYEITTNGYRILHVNHLEVVSPTIPIYTTEEYLNDHVAQYIDLNGHSDVRIVGFSQYPNTTVSGEQKGKILVEETLTTGQNVQYEYEVTFSVTPGELSYKVPETLTFKEFTKSRNEQIIQRKYSGNLGLSVKDSRGANSQGNWRLMAQIENKEDGLASYLIFRNSGFEDQYLNHGMTEIYAQEKQENATEPINVEISGQWTNDTGILLKVPAKNHLFAKSYTTTIMWNLVEGP